MKPFALARLCLALAAATSATGAAAQTATAWPGDAPPPSAAVLTLGLEPELVLSIGWMRALPELHRRVPLAAGVGLKVAPLALLDHGTWRVSLLVAGDARGPRGFGAAFTGSTYLAHDRNDVARLFGLGVEARVAPGFRGEAWQGGLDLGWQGTLLTHVRHSALARRTFEDRYPPGTAGAAGPEDGWYRFTANRFRLGLQGAHAFGDRVAVSLALGLLASRQRQGVLLGFELAQVPIYVESSVRVGW